MFVVLAKFHYTGPTRLCRRLSQKTRTFLKMADDRETICRRFFNYTSMQLMGYKFITEEEKKTLRVGEKVHP